MINALNNTFNNNRSTIPKWIVLIPEVDIISSIDYTEFGVSGAYGMLIDHIIKEIDSTIKYFTANLPYKANKYGRPYVLWLEPTLHINYVDNELRVKFTRSLHAAIQNNTRHVALPLRQFWNENDLNVVFSAGSVTRQGMALFTKAMDATVRFADTKLMRNYGVPFVQIFQKEKLTKDCESRIAQFQTKLTRNQAKKKSMLKQQQMRQQFQQIRRFFERREENNTSPRPIERGISQEQRKDQPDRCPQRYNTKQPSCRRNLFKKK